MKTQNLMFVFYLLSFSVNSFPQTANSIRVHLRTSVNEPIDNIVIRFLDDPAVTYLESSYFDVRSLNSGTFIASLKGTASFAIQSRPLNFTRDTVKLRVESTNTGGFKLVFTGYLNFAAAKAIWLLDTYTGAQQEVKANPVFDFAITSDPLSKGMNRFKMVFIAEQVFLTCPGTIHLNTAPGMNGTNVNFAAVATGKCSGVNLVYSSVPGSYFIIGNTNVTVTAFDSCGNQRSCNFSVIINDNEPPVIAAIPLVNLPNDAGRNDRSFIPGIPLATDNSSNVTVVATRSDGKLLTDPYPLGSTTITWTATDPSGNSTTLPQQINISDVEPPVIVVGDHTLSADTGSCLALARVQGAVVSDNSGAVTYSSARSDNQVLSAAYPKGTTFITWTATDGSGNTSTAIQKVIVEDREAPFLMGRDTVVTANFSGCSYKIDDGVFDPTASDNCMYVALKNNLNLSGSLNGLALPLGRNAIVWSAMDGSGNVTEWQQVINVQAPVINVAIPDVSALPLGSGANVIYLGYAPASSLQYTAVSSQSLSYQWDVTDNLSISGSAFNAAVKVTADSVGNGPQLLSLKVTDAVGCTTVFAKQLRVVDVRCGARNDRIFVCAPVTGIQVCAAPNTLTNYLLNGFRLGDCTATVGKTERKQVEFTPAVLAYPNPARGLIELQLDHFNTEKEVEVRVIDMTGKTISSRNYIIFQQRQTIKLDLQKDPPGIYNVQVITKTGVKAIKVAVIR